MTEKPPSATQPEARQPSFAFVTNVLANYRVPCFRELSRLMPGRVTFYFLTREMQSRAYILGGNDEDIPAVYLKGVRLPNREFDDIHLNSIWPVIKGNHDVIYISGWSEPTYLLLWLYCALFRKKMVFGVESTLFEGTRRGLKERFKRYLMGKVSGCIALSTRARQYCIALGSPEERTFLVPNATDRDYFGARAEELLPRKASLRAGRDIEEDGFVVLFVGRLVESFKQVSVLIKACGRLKDKGYDITLVIVGDGAQRDYYGRLAKEVGLARCCFTGTLKADELTCYYALSDVMVLPSASETWGFVLNEAMEFGLPLVVSDHVGASADLLREGTNGYVVPSGDVEALADAIGRLHDDKELRHSMSSASREIIKAFSPLAWANGVLRAVEAVAGGRFQ